MIIPWWPPHGQDARQAHRECHCWRPCHRQHYSSRSPWIWRFEGLRDSFHHCFPDGCSSLSMLAGTKSPQHILDHQNFKKTRNRSQSLITEWGTLIPAPTRKSTRTDFILVWPLLKSSPPIKLFLWMAKSINPVNKVPQIWVNPIWIGVGVR